MTEDLSKCLETICNFPTIYKMGDKTTVDIVKQSGYLDIFQHLTEDKIAQHISDNVGLVETWINFSEDMRHGAAWGFQTLDKSTWTVFYMDNGKMKKEFTFDHFADACAKMIKMTIDEIRKGV